MKHYFPELIHPAFLGPTGPITWGASHLPLSRLPIIDTATNSGKQWLITHNSSMWSARERTVRDSTLSGSTTHAETRSSFKDSLFSIFGHFADTPGVPQRTRFFGLANDAADGVHILLLANNSIVLDAACLPLTLPAVRALRPALEALHRSADGLCKVSVDANELRAWKAALPAMAERARAWPHKPDCAYGTAGSVPATFDHGASPLCGCGNGVSPDAFLADVDVWRQFRPFAVRVAVAPIFPALLAEAQRAFDPPDAWPQEMEEGKCGVCGREEKVGGGEPVGVFEMQAREVLLGGVSEKGLEGA
ncbi:putative mynd finger family protein [Neofusicoccum parvum UCRNP2]|uniref:Putative mynd finger family protein n=1 Tax=Botryosphaeria parva (strain UCR-NP2) TaxID=1287680 RepID=R1GNQ5_BOTPV|nr:putative mynd finger family protein [Neofusicoccum parvum UCRNP2]